MTYTVLDVREIAQEWQELLEGHDAEHPRRAELQAEIAEVYERGVHAPERQLLELASIDQDIEEDVGKYVDLCEQLGIEADPGALSHFGDSYEPTLIREDGFEEYAQELAEDIGAMPEGDHWPVYCIDWERAARELKVDYTSVTYDGDDYLMRSW